MAEANKIEDRLRPGEGGGLHEKILAHLISRRDTARQHRETRSDTWTDVNNRLRMFIDLSKKAKLADGTRDLNTNEMPFDRSIVVPASYSILHVLLTQLMSIFGSREPMIQVRGRAPEDIKPSIAMEMMMAYDLQEMQAFCVLYALCQDAMKFGCGIVYDTWDTEYGERVVRKQLPPGPEGELIAALLGPAGMVSREYGVVKEHNRWMSVDPFSYYPDPRVPISEPQAGEFVGHRFSRGYMYLLERSRKSGGAYFNIEQLKALGSERHDDKGDIGIESLGNEQVDEHDRGAYQLDHLQIKLIPSDWELGESDTPEIWWFTVANSSLIIRAHKNPYEHNQFTYAVAESDPDFHSAFNPGTVESLDGLQRYMDWLFNSHLQNLMKHLNDALVFSPALIEEADITAPGPARHIRLTQLGEELLMSGSFNIQQFVQQLPVSDVTAPHLNAVNQMFNLAQRMTAANDPQMGMPTPDKRTLGEIQVITASSSQRISIIARLMDSLAVGPLAKRAIANRMQFTSQEQFYRLVGDAATKTDAEHLFAGRGDVQGNFDYVPTSGILPPDPVRQARIWMQILQSVSQIPALQQPTADGRVINTAKIAEEAFRTLGARNIDEFYTQLPAGPPQVMPDGQVANQVQAGNMIPMEDA